MHRHFEDELKDLKDQILLMGGHVERAVDEASQALMKREIDRLEKVFEIEKKINDLHIATDEMCMNLLARQSPLAADLRLVLAVIKINNDLERMGDQAVNVASNSKHYLAAPAMKPLVDLPKMAQEVQWMIRSALESLVRGDLDLAHQVLKRDDQVDQLKHKIFQDVKDLMRKDPKLVDQGLNLILISRNLERLGDHATNIAEDVIFVLTGKDIRHGHN